VDPDAILDGLDPSQREAVTSGAAPLCILAGAGSGKTRVLTRRIAWRVATGGADPQRILALTFTRKAAGELTARLAGLGLRDRVAAGTFHAVAYAQLRRRWADGGTAPPTLLERKGRILAACGADTQADLGSLAGEIEWAKARLVVPERYVEEAARAGRHPATPPATVAELFERYEQEKQRRRLVDFDDLLALCLRALEADDGFAAAQRWRFRHLFVDEFQDVNPLQHRLLEAWRGDRPDLCVVGDPNQAIYAWNGADAGFLVGFLDAHPTGDVVRLDHSHRSTPQILSAAAALLDRPQAVRATRPDGPAPAINGFPDERAEAAGVARQLRDLHGGVTAWSSMAVLTRTHAQAAVIAAALTAAAIPHRLRDQRLANRSDVRDGLAELEAGGRARPLAAALLDVRDEVVAPLAQELLAVEPAATVEAFLEWVATADDAPRRAGRDAVDVCTFHAAKGLEWPVVFVAGVERGLVPIGHAATLEAQAEERRLFYVALTRATRVLRCTWAQERTFGSRPMPRERSPFLDAVEAAAAAVGVDAPVSPPPPVLPARAPSPVLTALRAWRSAAARAAGVPPTIVFRDDTLAALVEARPRHQAELVELPGIGPIKAARYGDDLLAVLAAAEAS